MPSCQNPIPFSLNIANMILIKKESFGFFYIQPIWIHKNQLLLIHPACAVSLLLFVVLTGMLDFFLFSNTLCNGWQSWIFQPVATATTTAAAAAAATCAHNFLMLLPLSFLSSFILDYLFLLYLIIINLSACCGILLMSYFALVWSVHLTTSPLLDNTIAQCHIAWSNLGKSMNKALICYLL